MKRGTPEERRWENGLRQSARTSDASTPVRCHAGPVPETKISSGKVAATAALQAYLFHDKDARSRIPRPRSVLARADVVSEKRLMIKPKESEVLAKNREPSDVESGNYAKAHNTVTSGAESPLSRFQKHVKQSRFQPKPEEFSSRNHRGGLSQTRDSIAAVCAQSLTQSLMDKVQEAKDLRHSQEKSKYQPNYHRVLGDRHRSSNPSSMIEYWTEPVYKTTFPSSVAVPSSPLQSSVLTSLKNSPPVPHKKPVIPAVSAFPPSLQPFPKKPAVEHQHSEQEAVVATPEEPASIINDVIEAANAALLIQRKWRRKLSHPHEPGIPKQNEVTLIIDKHVESVTPLFSAVKLTHQTGDGPKVRTDEVVAISPVKTDQVAGINSSMKATGGLGVSLPSFNPWTDQDLLFLEEGRCIGELQEDVRRRATMDQDELVWKRPQLVVQQLETQRMSTIQKARGKRRKRHQQVETPNTTETMESIERRNELYAKTANDTPLTGRKLRRKLKFPRVCFLKHRSGKGKAAISAGRVPSERRRMFTRVDQPRANFCISNNTNEPQDGDSNQADIDIAEGADSQFLKTDTRSIPAALDHFVVFSNSTETTDANASKSLRNDLICVGDLALARSLLIENGRPLHDNFIPLTQSPPNPPINEHQDEQVLMMWHNERYPHVDMVAGEYLDQEYSASLDSNDSYASTDSCTAKAVIQPIGQSTTDPMITLNIMKSAVTNAIAQIQHEYSPQPACNQLLEAAPIIPVAQLRLDEDKRLEFLRVLNDFKRCLRPTSCTSSTMSVQDYSSLQRTVKAEVLPREANKHSE